MSPVLPTYNAQRNIEAKIPEPPRQEAKTRAEMSLPLIETTGQIMEKWNSAFDTMQYTSAVAKFNTSLADIKSRADRDPDINAYPKYQKEIEDARKESLKGFQNKQVEQKAAIEFDYDSKIAGIAISDGFRKKQIDFGQAELLRGIDSLSQRSIEATNPAEAAKAEKNIEDLINANVATGVITAEDGAKQVLKARKDIPVKIAERDIDIDPIMAEKKLRSNDYGIEDPQERNRLINLSKSLQDLNESTFKRERIQTRFDTIAQIASGEIDFRNSDDLIQKTMIVDNDLAEAMQKVFSKRGPYVPEDEKNEVFQENVQKLFAAQNSEEISDYLIRFLKDNPTVSNDRLAVLVDAARMRAVNLPALKSGKPQAVKPNFFDGAMSVLRASVPPLAAADTFSRVIKRLKNENTKDEDILPVVNDEIRKQRLEENPGISKFSKDGQLCVDRFGNKALVYPDGTYSPVMSAAGDFVHKEPGKKREKK